MPKPRSPKEIKQFLGLTVYYRKSVPRFSDVARPLMNCWPMIVNLLGIINVIFHFRC